MNPARAHQPRLAALCTLAILGLFGCSRAPSRGWQGYLEGDFVYVSSPLAGRLDKLAVAKGQRVEAGAPLFSLERASEIAALLQATQTLEASHAQLEDMKKGSRPEEIAGLEAKLGRSRASAENSRLDFERAETLFKAGAISASEFDHARLAHEADERAVDQDSAQLATAGLGGRSDAVKAAGADARAAADAESRARWSVDQKEQAAPAAGLVYDTLYREGEFVTAGSPVVSLLPPANIKVRFFVPEGEIARVRAGDRVDVSGEGLPSPLYGSVSYVSPSPEYTPPVLYNQDNRSKLVYMVEAVFAPSAAADLHPGQPVNVLAGAR